MLKYIISSILLIVGFNHTFTQNKENNTIITKDSTIHRQSYGLRVGVDLSKPVRTFLNDYYSGFELVADYRISKKFFIAGELR